MSFAHFGFFILMTFFVFVFVFFLGGCSGGKGNNFYLMDKNKLHKSQNANKYISIIDCAEMARQKGETSGWKSKSKSICPWFPIFLWTKKKNHKLNIDGKKSIWLDFIYIIFSLKQKKNPNTKWKKRVQTFDLIKNSKYRHINFRNEFILKTER